MIKVTHIHPIIVHFPIALIFTSVLFDLAYKRSRNVEFFNTGYHLLVLGAFFGVMASGTGMYIEDEIEASGVSGQHVELHKVYALGMLAWFFALLTFRFFKKNKFSARVFNVYLVLSLAGLLLLSITGFYGGKLVYEDGAAVEGKHLNKRANIQ